MTASLSNYQIRKRPCDSSAAALSSSAHKGNFSHFNDPETSADALLPSPSPPRSPLLTTPGDNRSFICTFVSDFLFTSSYIKPRVKGLGLAPPPHRSFLSVSFYRLICMYFSLPLSYSLQKISPKVPYAFLKDTPTIKTLPILPFSKGYSPLPILEKMLSLLSVTLFPLHLFLAQARVRLTSICHRVSLSGVNHHATPRRDLNVYAHSHDR